MIEKNNLYKRLLLKLVFSIVLYFICAAMVKAQTKQSPTELPATDPPATTRACEAWIMFVDRSLGKWNENKQATLIVIVRVGGSESSSRLNQKRIKTLKAYISYRDKDRDQKTKVVFAEGDRFEADVGGVVEMYIEGKLYDSLAVPPGSDFPLRNCNP